MSLPLNLDAPRLLRDERDVLIGALAGSSRYLEFGAGGSTLLAVRHGVRTIVSVDSDPNWVAAVGGHAEIAPRVRDGTLSILHANIGPVRDWGFPADIESKDRWPNYLGVAWAEWSRRGETPDLVLVDGRFRVACCLSVVVATADLVWLQRPTLFLHDVVAERPDYKDVLAFFDVVSVTTTLFRLRVRRDAVPREALAQLLTRQFDDR